MTFIPGTFSFPCKSDLLFLEAIVRIGKSIAYNSKVDSVTDQETSFLFLRKSQVCCQLYHCLEFGTYDIGFILMPSVFWMTTKMWIHLTNHC